MCGRRKNCFSRFRWNSNNFVLVVILYICARQTHLMVCVVHAFFVSTVFFLSSSILHTIFNCTHSALNIKVGSRVAARLFYFRWLFLFDLLNFTSVEHFLLRYAILHVLFVHKPVLLVKIHSCTKCSCSIKLSTYFPDCVFVAVVVAILYSTTFFVLRTLRNVAI